MESAAQEILDTPRDERPATLTDEVIHDVTRNEHHKSFTLGDREFPLKDLAYDDYIEFCSLITPMIEGLFTAAKPSLATDKDGAAALDWDFDATALDAKTIVKMGGEILPRLCWLACRQTDKKITIDQVKVLCGGKPWPLMTVVFKQVKHNKIIEDIISFFPQLAELAKDLVPELAAVLKKA